MSRHIRAVIIGCGPSTPGKGGWHSISYAHGWALAACPEVLLVAAASRNPRNVADFCTEFSGAKGYTDYRQMIETERPDLVSVCAFPRDREAMVNAALEAGAKAVWIEKPFALGLGAAKRMMQTAEAKGARLFVNHQRRYGTPFRWLKDAACSRIGRLLTIQINQPGPSLLDFGSHLIDIALFCLEGRQAVEVAAMVDRSRIHEKQGIPVESHLLASVKFDDGARIIMEAGMSGGSLSPIMRIDGSEGFAELNLDVPPGSASIFRARYSGESTISNPASDEHFHHSQDPSLYVTRAARDIVRAMSEGGPTLIDSSEAIRGLEIMMAIYESGRTGQVVTLPLEQQTFPMDLPCPERI